MFDPKADASWHDADCHFFRLHGGHAGGAYAGVMEGDHGRSAGDMPLQLVNCWIHGCKFLVVAAITHSISLLNSHVPIFSASWR